MIVENREYYMLHRIENNGSPANLEKHAQMRSAPRKLMRERGLALKKMLSFSFQITKYPFRYLYLICLSINVPKQRLIFNNSSLHKLTNIYKYHTDSHAYKMSFPN